MLKREEWLELARELDWGLSYVREEEAFPAQIAGEPWLPAESWRSWDEPYRTAYTDYVTGQRDKEAAAHAVRAALGRPGDLARLPRGWTSAVKLHTGTLTLAEFAAVIGNLRAARFGRCAAWRSSAVMGALDELRHTQLPLSFMHEMVREDPQFDWTHKLYHSNDWVAIAARHFADELLVGANPIEFAIATHFVLETGFTNLQFVGLADMAHGVGDKVFEKMVTSIQTDEARHAQIGSPVLKVVAQHDRAYAQYLVDKWFWRSWLLFAIVTGFAMDYLAPLPARRQSFKEFVQEWILDQFLQSLEQHGLERPWYWDIFLSALDHYHHMVYASAYTYRSTVWFDLVLPGPEERAWLHQKYPRSFRALAPVWDCITDRWREADPGNDFSVHGTSIIGFCDLCQLVLCGGTPAHNSAVTLERDGQRYIFCSEPCRWIFEREPERYAGHRDVVKRVLAGEAPANLLALVHQYFGLSFDEWGKDASGGVYSWLKRIPR